MLRELLPLVPALLGAATGTIHAQVAFTGNYFEDFNSLGPAGTALPAGWLAVRHAGSGALGAPLTPGITAGTAASGGIFNVGATGDPDRALGSLSSSATAPRFGAQFLNQSGSTFTELSLSGVMSQWRSGSSTAVEERLPFEYSLNALDVNDGAALWLPLSSLDLVEVLTDSTSAGAVDGLLPSNRLGLNGTVTDLQWADQSTLTLRWTDMDDVGSDGLYALDQFRMSAGVVPVPEPGAVALVAVGLGLLAGARRWRRG